MLPSAPIFAIARHRINIDGKGVTTLVTFSGCPLACKYCLNPQCRDISQAKKYTPESLYEEVKIDNIYFLATNGGITFGGGEPCLRSEFIKEFRTFAPNWKLTVETSLYVDRSHLEKLLPIIDEYIIDIKDFNPIIYKEYTGKDIDLLMDNLRWLADAGKADCATIRIPLIPNYNNEAYREASIKELQEMGYSRFDKFNYVIKQQN